MMGSHGVPVRGERRCRGIATIWTVLTFMALFSLVALALDICYVAMVAQQLQVGADAAALAGASAVRSDPNLARTRAVHLADANTAAQTAIRLDRNDGNAVAGDVVVGRFDRATQSFSPTLEAPNAVQVRARRTGGSLGGRLALLFGPAFGINEVDVQRAAIAIAEPNAPQDLGIIVLRPSGPDAFQHSGNGTISVNGPIVVNSSSNKALSQSGNGEINAAAIRVRGDVYQSGGGEINAPIESGAPLTPDPLASLPVLGTSGLVVRATNPVSLGGGNHVLQPGIYRQGISISTDGTVTLRPGHYRIESKGFKVSGNGKLIAEGVFLYNGVGGNTDEFQISGNGEVIWTPPTSGTYEGIGLFQERSSDKKVQISGNGMIHFTGTVYAAGAQVQLSGNGATDVLAGAVIANTVQVSGDGSFGVDPQGAGTPDGDIVFLVQ